MGIESLFSDLRKLTWKETFFLIAAVILISGLIATPCALYGTYEDIKHRNNEKSKNLFISAWVFFYVLIVSFFVFMWYNFMRFTAVHFLAVGIYIALLFGYVIHSQFGIERDNELGEKFGYVFYGIGSAFVLFAIYISLKGCGKLT